MAEKTDKNTEVEVQNKDLQTSQSNNNQINKELELELSPEVEGCIYSCNNGWINRGLTMVPCPICNSLI